jgi:hypothetical protein
VARGVCGGWGGGCCRCARDSLLGSENKMLGSLGNFPKGPLAPHALRCYNAPRMAPVPSHARLSGVHTGRFLKDFNEKKAREQGAVASEDLDGSGSGTVGLISSPPFSNTRKVTPTV